MLAIAIAVGFLIGLSLGALGGGGSILTVPALVYVLGQTPHAATAGSLLIVGVTALAGTIAHWRAGRVRVGQGVVFGILGIVGSYVGSRLSASIDPNLLLAAFAVLILVAALAMVRRVRRQRARAADEVASATRRAECAGSLSKSAEAVASPGALPDTSSASSALVVLDQPCNENAASCTLPSPSRRLDACRALRVIAAATAVGLLTGLFGVGGGFVVGPALVLVLGFEMPVAVGTSLLVIAINSAVAMAVRMSAHTNLDWRMLAVFTAAAIGGSVAGSRVASRVDGGKLTIAFSILLTGVAAYTATRSLSALL